MTADVIDILEAVEVDDDEGEALARTVGSPKRLFDPIVEEYAVR